MSNPNPNRKRNIGIAVGVLVLVVVVVVVVSSVVLSSSPAPAPAPAPVPAPGPAPGSAPGPAPGPAPPQNPVWTKLDSSVQISQISSGNRAFIFGVDSANKLWYIDPASQYWKSFSNFQPSINNVQIIVAASQDGSIGSTGPSSGSLMVVNSGNGWIYRWMGTSFVFTSGSVQLDSSKLKPAPGVSLSEATASSGDAVVSVGGNSAYFYSNSAYYPINLSTSSLSIGSDFSFWGVGTAGNLNYSTNNGSSFTGVGNPGTALTQVSCSDSSRVFVLDSNGALYQYKNSQFNKIQGVPSNIAQISCGKDCVTVVDSSGQAWLTIGL